MPTKGLAHRSFVCRRSFVWWLPATVVVLGSLLAVVTTPWALTGDFSHTEFLVRMIPGHPPLVGVAARVRDFGSTPGPSMAYALAPGYNLFGRSSWALAASAGALHLGGIALSALVARRTAGRALAAMVGLTLSVAAVSFGPEFFLQPWNVWIPVFAFPAFALATWAVLCGHLWWSPAAVALGSHCVQTHVSYTVMVTASLAALAGWLVVQWRRGDSERRRAVLRPAAIASAVGLIIWAPPVIEQFQSGTGNLRKVISQFTEPDAPAVGIIAGARAMASRLNLLGPWLYDPLRDPTQSPNWLGFVLFCFLVGAAVRVALRRRDPNEIRLYVVLAVLTILGLLSAARVFGTFFEYVIRWMVPLAALWIAAAAWSLYRELTERGTVSSAAVVRVGVAAVIAMSGAAVVRAASAEIPYERDSAIAVALSDQLADNLPAGERYQINEFDPVSLGSVAFGLHLELEKRGRADGVGEWGRSGVKEHRVVTSDMADGELWFVAVDPVINAFAALPGAEVVATFESRTTAEVSRSEQLWSQVVDTLCANGAADLLPLLVQRWGFFSLRYDPRTPPELIAALLELTELRQPTAVVLLPVGAVGADIDSVVPRC
jgi:hypothetical protein